MTATNAQLVERFCDAWKQRDIDAILAFFADDAVYHNIPIEPARGLDAIRGVLEMFVPPAEEIDFEIHHLAADGDVVFTERTDRFVMNGKAVALPVAGVFEVQDGKITAWRDYFDLQTWISQSS